MPISIPQKNCLQMAVSHELYEDLDSLPRNQELYLNGLAKWAKSSYPLTVQT